MVPIAEKEKKISEIRNTTLSTVKNIIEETATDELKITLLITHLKQCESNIRGVIREDFA